MNMLIGGTLVPAADGARYPTYSPATGELLAEVPAASAADVQRAVEAAQLAQPEWGRASPWERAAALRTMAAVLRAHREELGQLDARDCGNPVTAMTGDVDMAADLLESFASLAGRLGGETVPGDASHLHYTLREPYGIVARIVPYNHPLMFAASRIAAPLAAGNAVLLKAPDQAPLSAVRMGELFAGLLPPGILAVLTGHGPVAGAALVAHTAVRRVAFTGSVATGQAVLRGAASSGIKQVTLELGGKNPMLVLPDADPDLAGAGAVAGMNFHWTGGQSCGSTSRLLVHRSLADDVVDRVIAGAQAVRVGDPLDPATEMGTMGSPQHRDRVLGYIEQGKADGLKLACGGKAPDGPGAFVEPTVFVDVPPDSALFREEIFGPVLVVTRYDDEHEAVAMANSSPLGLTASLWTRDLARAHRLARAVEAGYVWVNTVSRHFAGLPFGGVKDSGLGREENAEELLSYTQTKAVTVRIEELPMTESYDGIIIGAGQHGLILGSYLASAGLRILLAERRGQAGGGLSTEEVTLPGFRHNLHSVNHFSISSTPWFRDLGLSARVRYITPRYEFAQPHRDGSALVFSRDLGETLASIARFSARDAQTFSEWNAIAEEMTQRIFLKERYSEPLSREERDEILGRSELGRQFLELTRRQPGEVVEELFEDERVKVLFLFKLSLFGTVLHEALGNHSPLGSLIRAFDLTTGYELCEGGSASLARGLMGVFAEAGGTFEAGAQAERIIIEGGRATGVQMSDGRSVMARQFVASTVDVHQTFEDMIGRDQLPAAFLEKLDSFSYTGWTLFGLHLALREPPAYLAAQADPHLGQALKYNIGSETMQSLMDAHEDVENGRVPRTVQFGAGALTVLDPTQAPPGMHTAYAWHVIPYAPDGDHENLKRLAGPMTEAILEKWREYAPNMGGANVLGSYTYTAYQYAKDIVNMRSGDIFMGALSGDQVLYNHFGYRTPVGNLYLAGSATHPNGAITGGAGYITAGIIASDLGVKPWWQPLDARTELAGLGRG